MASADHSFLSLCLLLLVLTATTATTAAAPAPHRRLHQTLPARLDDDADPSRGPPPVLPPAVESCWKSILASESCEDDVLRALATQQVRISKACCSVLEKIGDKCLVAAFSRFPFNPTYPNIVKNACGILTA